MLTIYIDFKSPASYLAFQPTMELIDRVGVAVRWLPFRAVQQPIPKKVANETAGQSHRRIRAIARQKTHKHYAKLQGIYLCFRDDPGRTDLALGVLSQISHSAENYIRQAFQAYWHDKLDLNDLETVNSIIEKSDNVGLVQTSKAQSTLTEAMTVAEELGVIDTPAYLVHDQLFIGREHLPWIEEILMSQ